MLPDAGGPCPQVALIGNKELLSSQCLGRETEVGLLDYVGKRLRGGREENMKGRRNHWGAREELGAPEGSWGSVREKFGIHTIKYMVYMNEIIKE